MKYVNSIYTPDQTGRLGGVVFGKNKYGYFIKVFKPPVNPKTLAQQNIRAFFAAASRQWAALTSDQRTAWNNIAAGNQSMKKGVSITLTGFTLFVKQNRNLQDIGMPFYENADMSTMIIPADMNGSSVDIDLTVGSEDIKLNIPATLGANVKAIVYATPVLKDSRQTKWNLLRVIGTIDSTFLTGSSIKTQYLAKFKSMPGVGDTVGFAVMPVDKTCGLTNSKVFMTAVGIV